MNELTINENLFSSMKRMIMQNKHSSEAIHKYIQHVKVLYLEILFKTGICTFYSYQLQ